MGTGICVTNHIYLTFFAHSYREGSNTSTPGRKSDLFDLHFIE